MQGELDYLDVTGDQAFHDLRTDNHSSLVWEELGSQDLKPQFTKTLVQAITGSTKHVPGLEKEHVSSLYNRALGKASGQSSTHQILSSNYAELLENSWVFKG